MQEKRFQNRINLFTFALTILVIWVHSVNLEPDMLAAAGLAAPLESGGYRAALFVERFLTNVLGQMAVPGFFIVSAWLFFRNAPECFSILWIIRKWRSRLFSVLLPYLVWNGLYYLGRIAAGALDETGAFPARLWESLMQADAAAVFSALFLYAYNPVFWYLKQLLVLFFLVPLIWILLKNRSAGMFMLLLFLLAAGFWALIPVHIVNEDALFYFALGAFAALHGKEQFECWGERSGRILGTAAAVLSISACILAVSAAYPALLSVVFSGGTVLTLCYVLLRASFCASAYLILLYQSEAALYKNNGRLRAFLERNSLPAFMQINFFIYATHYIPVRAINKSALLILAAAYGFPGASGAADGSVQSGMPVTAVLLLFLIYLLLPVVCTVLALVGSLVLKRFLPAAWRVLSGGR